MWAMDNVGKRFDSLKRQFIGCGPADRPTGRPADRPTDRPANRPADRPARRFLPRTSFFWRRVALFRDVFFHFSAKKMAICNGVLGTENWPILGCPVTHILLYSPLFIFSIFSTHIPSPIFLASRPPEIARKRPFIEDIYRGYVICIKDIYRGYYNPRPMGRNKIAV